MISWRAKARSSALVPEIRHTRLDQQGIMMVVDDVRAVRQELKEKGVDISAIDEQPWGTFAYFKDPDGNGWTLQQLPYKRD